MDEKELNNYTSKLFENYKIQRPPEDFTDKLMLKIELAKNPVKQEKAASKSKFIYFFILTFSSLLLLGYFIGGNSDKEHANLMDKLNLPYFDIQKLMNLLHFNIEIGLFAKLIIGSIVILVIIDLLTGSLIDYFLDSKAKMKDRV